MILAGIVNRGGVVPLNPWRASVDPEKLNKSKLYSVKLTLILFKMDFLKIL